MYSVGGATMIFGVLLSLGFVIFMIWYFNKQIDNKLKDKEWLICSTRSHSLTWFIYS